MLQETRRISVLRRASLAAGALAALLAVSSCSATYESKEVGSCSPSYSIGDKTHGHLSVSQPGKDKAIAYGLYVAQEYKIGSSFTLNVYADGVKIEGKSQNYEPHGSVSAQRAKKYSGKILELRGNVVHDDDTIFFSAKCRIA